MTVVPIRIRAGSRDVVAGGGGGGGGGGGALKAEVLNRAAGGMRRNSNFTFRRYITPVICAKP